MNNEQLSKVLKYTIRMKIKNKDKEKRDTRREIQEKKYIVIPIQCL